MAWLRTVQRLSDGQQPNIADLPTTEPDWQDWWTALHDHRLCNLAYPLLNSDVFAPLLPEATRSKLAEHRARQQLRQTVQRELLAKVVDSLQAHGVETLVLKGFATATLYYEEPLARYQNDLDLLVRPAQVNAAVRALAELGVPLPRPGFRVSRRRRQSDYELTLRQQRVAIDLHWKIRSTPGFSIQESTAWEQTVPFILEGRTYHTAGPDYSLTLLLVCLGLDVGRGACRLKHFVDVYRLLSALPADFDWAGYFERKKSERIHRLCVQVLSMLRHLFPATMRHETAPSAFSTASALHTLPQALTNWATRENGRLTDLLHSIQLLENPRPDLRNKFWLWQQLPFAPLETLWYLGLRCSNDPERIPEAIKRCARLWTQSWRFTAG